MIFNGFRELLSEMPPNVLLEVLLEVLLVELLLEPDEAPSE